MSDRLATIQAFLATQQWPALKDIFSWSYWTEPDINPISSVTFFGLAALAIFLVSTVIWRSRLQKAQQNMPLYGGLIIALSYLIIFSFVLALVYLFCRAQELPYFSSRLIILAGGLVILLWLGGLLFWRYQILKSKEAAYLEQERFFRYLPKKRK